MLIVASVLAILVLYGVRVSAFGSFHADYCSPRKTNALKGVFVLAVFLSHMKTYISIPQNERLLFTLVAHLGQLMVVPFLFWSGYGVMESIQKKGLSYVRKIPAQRIGKTLLHFDLAVLVFLLVRYVVGEPVRLSQFLFALIGWRSIGNSAWYVFVIVLLYGITAVSFGLFQKNLYLAATAATALAVLSVVVLAQLRDLWWHDTLLCYLLGMWFSLLRNPLEKLILRNDLTWLCTLVLTGALFLISKKLCYRFGYMPHVCALVFAVLMVLLSAKISLDNRFLQFLGKYTFWLYILQRIPMILMKHFGICTGSPAAFLLVSFGVTSGLAVLFEAGTKKLDGRLFRQN